MQEWHSILKLIWLECEELFHIPWFGFTAVVNYNRILNAIGLTGVSILLTVFCKLRIAENQWIYIIFRINPNNVFMEQFVEY